MSGVFLGVFAETELPDELAKDMTVSIFKSRHEILVPHHQSVSRAGGPPYVVQDTWLSDHYPRCRMCGKEMVFVLQLFSDYDPETYRFLHVFVCPSMTCSRQNGGWRCFRTMRPVIDTSSSSVGRAVTAEKFNFMSSTQPAASAEGGAADAFDLSDLAKCLGWYSSSSSASTDVRLCNVPGVRVQPKEETSITLTPGYQNWSLKYLLPFVLSYMSFRSPRSGNQACRKKKSCIRRILTWVIQDPSLLATVKESHGAVIADDDFAGIEEDERNTSFLKFQERINRFAGQVLRYDYNGSPLWAGKFAEESKKVIARQAPPCRACGAPRAFEFQLLPSLFYLSGWFEGHESEMEWGIAAMYTCSEDCRGSGGLSFNPTASVYEEFVLLEPSAEGDNSPSETLEKGAKKGS
ncbi:hypothetical protein FOZ60_014632 [Perkinsus olseni]|uniref:Programmed cell death protein 2 C-terminal domain-containing protein n=1 Tax=Perkinsus olseni TaxID=32597 RepID=A0A7J6PLK9_PEROL|nr:hypothetical protein FOZ60_014632 [Perkinsus olseni]